MSKRKQPKPTAREKRLSAKIVRELFTNASGKRAENICLCNRRGDVIGSWGEEYAADYVADILAKGGGDEQQT